MPAVFVLEETKYKDVGKIKIPNYDIFELVRESRDGGGGLALGCLKELQAVWVREGNDQVEALSVEIFLRNMKIRCCVAYGCQENEKTERKEAFWTNIDEEVKFANNSGSGFALHFDGNLWAGPNIIPGDPRSQNRNGKKFQDFLERHPHLSVVNSLPNCEGLITRCRSKDGKEEKSVLDFFVICDRLLPFLTKMVIDEDKRYILTNYQKVRRGGQATDSDHYTQFMDLNLKIKNVKPERLYLYNFKSKECQMKFNQMTSETSEFSKCFQSEAPLVQQIDDWQRVLKSFCRKTFTKIRIKDKNIIPINKKISQLISLRNELLRYDDQASKNKVEELNNDISSLEAEDNRNKLFENFQYFNDNPESINMSQMWKLMKKIWPKVGISLPTAKRNHMGKIVSGAKELKILLAKEYKERLRSRPVRPDMKKMKIRKQKIFKLKMRLAESRRSPDWTMKNLDDALARLKNNKSRDNDGLINEIFKNGIIGQDLKRSLLMMFNKMKKEHLIHKFMNVSNITTVPKSGSRIELRNQRGIFRTSVVRSILMGLIYGSKYQIVDSKMSDCQMGGRKRKGCKNNIFILNGIIHDVVKSKKMKPVLYQFYDYSQMFDSINLQEAISDIYDAGIQDEQLALIYKANQEISMAVKTPTGLTERQTVSDIVLQGDTFGSLLASVQVDMIGKDCMEAGHHYLYKNLLPIGFLGLVDDIVGITEAGFKAQELNAYINIKTAEKRLQFGVKKCKSMLIGKTSDSVLNNNLQVDNWSISYEEDKITGEAVLNEHFLGKVEIDQVQEYTYLGFVISNKGDNMANIRAMQKKSHGVIRKIMNKLDSLNLKHYYFECAMLLMNIMLRGSILYASDMYYDLKERELRQIERIEDNFLRKVLKTTKGCPITQMYLEMGQFPARFEIQKLRLLFLKTILEQDDDSNLKKFFNLQMKYPSRGDWASTCISDLNKLQITLTLDEIKVMTKDKYTRILKSKIESLTIKTMNKRKRDYLLALTNGRVFTTIK